MAEMYSAYFGLQDGAFALAPDPRYMFMSPRHREALAHLLYGVQAGGGFVELTGEAGTGKTTLCRCLLEQLPTNVDVALILNPCLDASELVAALCDELKIAYPAGTTSLKVLVDHLNIYLLAAHAENRRTVLIIDEAQNLSRDVLEQIRLLTNIETATHKLLQIILIGQPELRVLLQRDDMRQLAQRITARYHLPGLTSSETKAYVQHRLAVAGRKGPLFTQAALHLLHRLSGGIPRRINVMCDRALLGAYAEDKDRANVRILRRAASEVRHQSAPRWPARSIQWLSVAALLVTVVVTAWVFVPGIGQRAAALANIASLQTLTSALFDDVGTVKTKPLEKERPSAQQTPSAVTAAQALDALLLNPALSNDAAGGFRALFARWRLDYESLTGATPCARAQSAGLRCIEGDDGTWDDLQRFRLPAVIKLVDGHGRTHHVLVDKIDADKVILKLAGRREALAQKTVAPLWYGDYLLLWRAPDLTAASLRPGMRGTDILWLRRRLDAVQGVEAPASDPALFDAALQERVMRFQRERALPVDGIVGEGTLLQLTLYGTAADGDG